MVRQVVVQFQALRVRQWRPTGRSDAFPFFCNTSPKPAATVTKSIVVVDAHAALAR